MLVKISTDAEIGGYVLCLGEGEYVCRTRMYYNAKFFSTLLQFLPVNFLQPFLRSKALVPRVQ